jgi:hypothetical protein
MVVRRASRSVSVVLVEAVSDVIVDAGCGLIRVTLATGVVADAVAEAVVVKAVVVESVEGAVAESVEGRCDVVRVRMVIPGSVVAAGVPWSSRGFPSSLSTGCSSSLPTVFVCRLVCVWCL